MDLLKINLSAIDAEVVHECGWHAMRVKRNVEVFVKEEVVSRSLADDTEIVDERFFNSNFRVELILGDTCALILDSGRLTVAANPLWLEMRGDVDSSRLVHRETKQYV